MTERDRRGRQIYLVLATITVLVKLGGLLPLMRGDQGRLSKLIAIVIVPSVIFLWTGAAWAHRLVAAAFVFSGVMTLIGFARSLDALDLYGFGVAFRFFLGIVDVLTGLGVLFQPDLNAFFRHQRDGKPKASQHKNRESPSRSRKRQVMAACVWGLVLGGGSGILLAVHWAQSIPVAAIFAQEAREDIKLALAGLLAACLMGAFVGLLVGTARPDASLTLKRLVVERGRRVAWITVVTGIVLSAVHGFFFAAASSDFPIPLGWQSAGVQALIFAVIGTPVVGSVAFMLGAVIALLLVDGDHPAVDWSE
jgi:hypothetical protein